MKNKRINLRIDKDIKMFLEVLSESKTRNISSIVREAIKQHLIKEFYPEYELDDTKNGLYLIKSLVFTEFVFWLYRKAFDPKISETKKFYIQLIELITECKKHRIFNSELLIEFDKVSEELNRVLYDNSYSERYFQFTSSDTNSFDYQVLADFMFTFRYDQEDNKVIHCI